jgi:hypothetical protein
MVCGGGTSGAARAGAASVEVARVFTSGHNGLGGVPPKGAVLALASLASPVSAQAVKSVHLDRDGERA